MSIIYRYGISMLSRKNHIKAEPEELMIDKQTGQILLKQANGKIISYDAMTRFSSSVNMMASLAERQLFLGKLVGISPENKPLPSYLASGDQVLVSEVVNLGNVKKLVIQLDVDVINTDTTFGDIKNPDKVKAEIKINRGGQVTTIKEPLLQLNEKIISFDTSVATSITSIKIINEDVVDNMSSQYILHNILALIG